MPGAGFKDESLYEGYLTDRDLIFLCVRDENRAGEREEFGRELERVWCTREVQKSCLLRGSGHGMQWYQLGALTAQRALGVPENPLSGFTAQSLTYSQLGAFHR